MVTWDIKPVNPTRGTFLDQIPSLRDLSTGFTTEGAVQLLGARIGGHLSLEGATLRNPTGPALVADRFECAAGVSGGFTAEGAGDAGTVRLPGARIGGQLSLTGATLRNPAGPALEAERLDCGDSVNLDERFTAEGAGDAGTVRLLGARIGNHLSLSRATLSNSTGPALRAERLQTGGHVFPSPPMVPASTGRSGCSVPGSANNSASRAPPSATPPVPR